MINYHQNKKNGQKGNKTALNSQHCVVLTFFLVFSNITFSALWTMWILYLLGTLAQLYVTLLKRSKVTRTQSMLCKEFKSGTHLSDKIEIWEFALIGVKWSHSGKKWHYLTINALLVWKWTLYLLILFYFSTCWWTLSNTCWKLYYTMLLFKVKVSYYIFSAEKGYNQLHLHSVVLNYTNTLWLDR